MFHMFRSNVSIEMMIYECLMLMLMLCKSSCARLTPEVLHMLLPPSLELRIRRQQAQRGHHLTGAQQPRG